MTETQAWFALALAWFWCAGAYSASKSETNFPVFLGLVGFLFLAAGAFDVATALIALVDPP